MKRELWTVLCAAALSACVRQNSGGEGGAGGSGEGAGGGSQTQGCASIDTENACVAQGCAWRDGAFFAGPPYDCTTPQTVHVCTSKGGGGYFDTTQHWKLDSAEGRTIIALGDGEVISEYQKCGMSCAGTAECSMCPCLTDP